MSEKLEWKDVQKAVEIITEQNVPKDNYTFFAYWAWWEGLGRPDDYFGIPMLVLCDQDGMYHTPKEIKEKGW